MGSLGSLTVKKLRKQKGHFDCFVLKVPSNLAEHKMLNKNKHVISCITY